VSVQSLDGVVLAERAVFDGAQYGVELVQLQLAYVDIAEEIAGKRLELLAGLHQPLEHRVRVHLEHPGGGANA
jgi:hypothetical protein